MDQKRQKYNITFATYQNSQYIISECSDITFINKGTTNAFINGFLLPAGSSLGFTAQFNEIDTTKYSLVFNDPTIANNSVAVIKKIYV
jgi:hypothetical protein